MVVLGIQKASRPLVGDFKPLDITLPEDFDDPVAEWIEAFENSQNELELPN